MVGNSTGAPHDYVSYIVAEPELDIVPWWTVICSYVVVFLGLFGNLMSISLLLLLKEVRKTSMHLFVFNLAISDFLFLITIALTTSQDWHRMWIFSEGLCKLTMAVQQICHAQSVLLLTAMSIGRFVDSRVGSSTGMLEAVWRFFRNYTYQVILVLIFWIVSAMYSIFFSIHAYKIGVEPHCVCSLHFPTQHDCSGFEGEWYDMCKNATEKVSETCINLKDDYEEDYPFYNETGYSGSGGHDWNYLEEYIEQIAVEEEDNVLEPGCHYMDMPQAWYTSLYLRMVFTFLIPSLIMIVFNYGIARNLMKTNVMRIDEEDESNQQRSSRLQAIKCMALVICFIVCWLPNHTVHMLKIKGMSTVSSSFCYNLRKVASLFAFIHSFLNPIIYMTIGNDFRPRYKKARKTLLGFFVRKRTRTTTEIMSEGNMNVNFTRDRSDIDRYSISISMKEAPIVRNVEEVY